MYGCCSRGAEITTTSNKDKTLLLLYRICKAYNTAQLYLNTEFPLFSHGLSVFSLSFSLRQKHLLKQRHPPSLYVLTWFLSGARTRTHTQRPITHTRTAAFVPGEVSDFSKEGSCNPGGCPADGTRCFWEWHCFLPFHLHQEPKGILYCSCEYKNECIWIHSKALWIHIHFQYATYFNLDD